jgi:predicted NACHT family NTPase
MERSAVKSKSLKDIAAQVYMLEIGAVAASSSDGLDEDLFFLLLDGFDEILDHENRARVVGLIQEFVHQCPDSSVIVATRPLAFPGELEQRLGWAWFQLAPLDYSEIAEFVRTRLPDRNAAIRFVLAVSENAQLLSLAHTPLLLSLLMEIYLRSDSLPSSRLELYRAATESIARWDVTKGEFRGRSVDLRELLDFLLPALAWRMQSAGDHTVTASELRRVIADIAKDGPSRERRDVADAFIRNVSYYAGVFSSVGSGPTDGELFGFIHLTFQEYFASVYLRRRWQLEGPSALDGRIDDERWEGVISLAVAGFNQTERRRFIQDLLRFEEGGKRGRMLVLAARFLVEGNAADYGFQSEILDLFARRASDVDPEVRIRAATALAITSQLPSVGERAAKLLHELSTDADARVRGAAAADLECSLLAAEFSQP